MADDHHYIPGDPFVSCDRCAFKVRMSQTRKTWDGLRVCLADYEIKHPQLTIRGIPDNQAVYDGRPEPADSFVSVYPFGTFTLTSPNGTNYIVSVADAGTIGTELGTLGTAVLFLHVGDYLMTVDNNGNLATTAATSTGPPFFKMHSPDNTAYRVTTPGGTITVTAE